MNLDSNVINKLKLNLGEPKRHNEGGKKIPKKFLFAAILSLGLAYLLWKFLKSNNNVESVTIEEPYLPLTGGTMGGDIILPSCHHVSVADPPAEPHYAANKAYVDSQIKDAKANSKTQLTEYLNLLNEENKKTFLPLTGGTLTGPVVFESGTLTVPSPVTELEAVNKKYLDERIVQTKDSVTSTVSNLLKEYLPLSGGTISGDMIFTDPYTINVPLPTKDSNAANKLYVDNIESTLKTTIIQNVNDTLTKVDELYLPLTGGTMKGDIIMPAETKVIITDPPSSNLSATNKDYVDNVVKQNLEYVENQYTLLQDAFNKSVLDDEAKYLALAGGTLTGNLNAPSVTIQYPPKDETSAVNKAYADKLHADGKNYVDTTIASLQDATSTNIDQTKVLFDTLYLPLTGGTLTGPLNTQALTISNAPAGPTSGTNKNYVDSVFTTLDGKISAAKQELTDNLSLYLPLTGGILTGPLLVDNTVTLATVTDSGSSAVNKEYVDTKFTDMVNGLNFLPLEGGTMKGTITMASGATISIANLPKNPQDAANKTYVDSMIETLNAETKAKYLPLAGGTLTGNLNMAENTFITLTKDPVNPTDAVNKAYADNSRLRSVAQYSAPTKDGTELVFTDTISEQNYNKYDVTKVGSKITINNGALFRSGWRVFFIGRFDSDTQVTIINEDATSFDKDITNDVEDFVELDPGKSTTFSVTTTAGNPTTGTISVVQIY